MSIRPERCGRKVRRRSVTIGLIASVLIMTIQPRWVADAQGQAFDLPDFGSSADAVLSSAEQRRLGEAFLRYVRETLPVLDDPLLTEYINDLGKRLVNASGEQGEQFDFFLINQPIINAFAGPGGHIGVFAGLVLTTETESELAAVIAHEIAHVTQDHIMRMVEDQKRTGLPLAALVIGAAILGAQLDSNAGAVLAAGAQAAAIQRRINFTRDNEKEADRVGIATLAAGGFDPYAMPGFFERLSRASRIYENNAPEFLRTHPVNSNRISDALGRADDYGHKQRPDDLRFHLVRADLKQRSFARADAAVDYFAAQLKNERYRSGIAAHYGYALALLRAERIAAAAREAERLLGEHPHQAEFVILVARIDLAAGRAGSAVDRLRTEAGLSPNSLPLQYALGEALLAAGRPREALAILEDLMQRRDVTPSTYRLTEDAALRAGDKVALHRYRGERLYREGELEPAIRQFETALRQRDIAFHEAARVQARLDVLKAEQERRKKEGKDKWDS